ncbi:MAG: redox-regulated ATPase YchF [Myxococcales bacterium]|nr:redox-regulated ATPase YchF [Myxococcales bacterium]USN51389.1 MAG: redox-regulated ATPase YchF [Myxococcales bacterium]
MSLTCGIVGLPNVGKSTLFNCLTAAKAEAANYPFCTIDPNVGVVSVPDERLDELAKIVEPERCVPAVVSFVDIAGLVKGASQGEGLGNKFLSHIREANAICHMVRCFENQNVVHVEGKIDPLHDVEIIETELVLKDMDSVEKQLHKAQKNARGPDKLAKKLSPFLESLFAHLSAGNLARTFVFDQQDEDLLTAYNELHMITSKPTLFIANVSEEGLHQDNKHVEALRAFAQKRGDEVVSICAKIEEELKDLSEEDRTSFLTDLGLESAGLERVIKKAYALLGLATYFTAGVKEVRAWTFEVGSKAPQAAGVIHSDFERGFIRAEVIAIDDFIKFGGEAKAKAAGKVRTEGKDYVVQDGDVMHFRFNV